MAKLWFKNYDLNELLEKFTVGNDYILDKNLVVSDCLCSIAHIQMLSEIGILTKAEFKALKAALLEIIKLDREGKFEIKLSDEDCHTAIEGYLTAKLGEAGKKVHTGRSRNDQVLTATRFYAKTRLLQIIYTVEGVVGYRILAVGCVSCNLYDTSLDLLGNLIHAYEYVRWLNRVGVCDGSMIEEIVAVASIRETAYCLIVCHRTIVDGISKLFHLRICIEICRVIGNKLIT